MPQNLRPRSASLLDLQMAPTPWPNTLVANPSCVLQQLATRSRSPLGQVTTASGHPHIHRKAESQSNAIPNADKSPSLLILTLVHTLILHDLYLSINAYTVPLCRSIYLPSRYGYVLLHQSSSCCWFSCLCGVCSSEDCTLRPVEGLYFVRPFRSRVHPTMARMPSVSHSLAF